MGVKTQAAGERDQRITLQQRVAGSNALGQAISAWANLVELWASAEPLRGREFFAAGQTQSEVSTRFTVAWRAGVTSALRVVWRGQAYDIVAVVEPLGQGQILELMCTQGVGDGR